MKITQEEIKYKLNSLELDENLHTALIVAESGENNNIIITTAGDCSPIIKVLMATNMILDFLGEAEDDTEFDIMLEMYADIIVLQFPEEAEKLGNLILKKVKKSSKYKINLS